MEERLNITLCGIGGIKHLSPLRSDTLRQVIDEAQFLPSSSISQPLCMIRGNQVHVDLSLASLDVKDGDTITVMFPNSEANKSQSRAKHIEKLERDIKNEALRVIDLQFSVTESTEYAPAFYQTMYNELNKENSHEIEIPQLTIISNNLGPNKKISEAPLPVCWGPNEFDFSTLFPQLLMHTSKKSNQKKDARKRSKKNCF